jgi:hypothetical protein
MDQTERKTWAGKSDFGPCVVNVVVSYLDATTVGDRRLGQRTWVKGLGEITIVPLSNHAPIAPGEDFMALVEGEDGVIVNTQCQVESYNDGRATLRSTGVRSED